MFKLYAGLMAITGLCFTWSDKDLSGKSDPTVIITEINSKARYLSYGSDGMIIINDGPNNESVVIVSDDNKKAEFGIKGRMIKPGIYEEFNQQGQLLYKAMITGRYVPFEKHQKYFGHFFGTPEWIIMYHAGNPSRPNQIIYKDVHFNDSIYKYLNYDGSILRVRTPTYETEFYETGIPAKHWIFRGPTYYYYPGGTLRKYDHGYNRAEYYESGILKRAENDTFTGENDYYTSVREYYSAGTLHKVMYFKDETPILEWLEYKPDGTLLKKIKKTAAVPAGAHKDLDISIGGPDAHFFVSVDESAQFPGGQRALSNYFDDNLTGLRKAKGNYKLEVRITKEGKPAYVRLEGKEAPRITDQVKVLVAGMPIWKSCMMDGRNIEQNLVINFVIQ